MLYRSDVESIVIRLRFSYFQLKEPGPDLRGWHVSIDVLSCADVLSARYALYCIGLHVARSLIVAVAVWHRARATQLAQKVGGTIEMGAVVSKQDNDASGRQMTRAYVPEI